MSDFSFGGAGNSISKLCLSLSKKDYKISIISLGKCDYSKIFKKNKIKVYELKKRKLILSIFTIYNLLKKLFIKEYKNILVSNIHYNNIILTLLAKKIFGLKIVLVERWDTRKHHENYVAYRKEKGDIDKIMPMLSTPPKFIWADLVDA